MNFPNDDNGDVLRKMHEDGDDLSKSRIIDFNHIFSERRQALSFVEKVLEEDFRICVSFYASRKVWQATVSKYMLPIHGEITQIETTLARSAVLFGGESDGWGCMQVSK